MTSPSTSLHKALIVTALLLLGVVKTLYIFRGVHFSTPFPVLNEDFAIYFAHALRSHELLQHSGRVWGYDPFQMAGYPFSSSLAAAGHFLAIAPHYLRGLFSIDRSLLLLEFLGLLSVPFLAGLAALIWTEESRVAIVFFGVILFTHGFIEPISRLFLEKALFPFQLCVFVTFCQIAFFRWWTLENTWPRWILQTVFSVLAPMMHPAASVIAFLPCLIVLVPRLRRPPPYFIVQLLLSITAVIAANWQWIAPALAFSSWISTTDYLKGFGLTRLFGFYGFWGSDYTENMTSIFNVFFLIIGATTLYRLRHTPSLFYGYLSWALYLLIIVGFGHALHLENIQPFRYVLPFWIFIYFLASMEIVRWLAFPSGRRAALVLALSASALITAQAAKNGLPRWANTWPDFQAQFMDYLDHRAPLPGRLLMECREQGDPHFLEYLAERTHVQILGGPFGSSFLISKFTLFVTGTRPVIFEQFLSGMPERKFDDYMALYNVSEIAGTSPQAHDLLKRFSSLTEQQPVGRHWIFDVKKSTGWFQEGEGTAAAALDHIALQNLSAGELILKYHWIVTLKTNPPLPMAAVYLLDDPVPFIKIDNSGGVKQLLVYNAGLNS